MKKYILLSKENTVTEIIPEINPEIPEFTLVERYPQKFIDQLIAVDESLPVEQSWVYDRQSGVFSEAINT